VAGDGVVYNEQWLSSLARPNRDETKHFEHGAHIHGLVDSKLVSTEYRETTC